MTFLEFHDLILSLPSVASREGETACARLLDAALADLSLRRSQLSLDEDAREIQEFRRLLLPLLQESAFIDDAYRKPRGHAGDFVTQEMIWRGRTAGDVDRRRGRSLLGQLLNALTFEMAYCKASQERVYVLRDRIRRAGPCVASIGSGAGIELWTDDATDGRRILLLDSDGGALARARANIRGAGGTVTYVEQDISRFIVRGPDDPQFRECDLVYSIGLFDGLDVSEATYAVRGLWPIVARGGDLVITNAHPGNPSRYWLEYACDWFLAYKGQAAMMAMADALGDVAQATVTLDRQGVYQYLEITKS